MKGIALIAALLLAGCAGSGPGATVIPLAAVQPTTGADTSISSSTEIVEVDLQSLPKEEPEPSCRKEAPTGSRIAVLRCTPQRSTAEEELDQYVLQRSFELMRAQAMYEEQQRQAREAAMRQMPVSPGGQ